MIIMGIDASTSTIGLSVIDHSKNKTILVHLEYFKPNKKLDILEMLQQVQKYIISKIDEFKPDEIILEDILLGLGRKTTIKTLAGLAVLNRTVGLAVLNRLNKPPIMYNVLKVRHAIKLSKVLPKKEEIPELVAKILNIKFPYVFNKKQKQIIENQDMADSIALILAYIKKEL